MSTSELLTTTKVAEILGISRQAVIERVNRRTLTPVHKIATVNGAYLFDAEYIQAVRLRSDEAAS